MLIVRDGLISSRAFGFWYGMILGIELRQDPRAIVLWIRFLQGMTQ